MSSFVCVQQQKRSSNKQDGGKQDGGKQDGGKEDDALVVILRLCSACLYNFNLFTQRSDPQVHPMVKQRISKLGRRILKPEALKEPVDNTAILDNEDNYFTKPSWGICKISTRCHEK